MRYLFLTLVPVHVFPDFYMQCLSCARRDLGSIAKAPDSISWQVVTTPCSVDGQDPKKQGYLCTLGLPEGDALNDKRQLT